MLGGESTLTKLVRSRSVNVSSTSSGGRAIVNSPRCLLIIRKLPDAPALMVTIDWTEDPGTVSRSAPSPGRQCRVAGSRRWTFPRRTGSRHMLVIYPSADHQGNRGYPWFLPWSRGSRRPVPEAGGPVFDRSRCRAHGIGSAAFARPRVFPEPSTFQFVTLRNQFLHRLLLKWTVRISAAKRL